jgi:Holliday junction resolvase
MQNKNYLSGRRKEYELKKMLENQNFTVLRTAGSKGVFDLIAFDTDSIRFIQVKSSRRKKKTYKQEIERLKFVQLPDHCTKELWIYTQEQGWETFLIP